MEKRELVIAAIAASAAAGCIRCMERSKLEAFTSGLTENEILDVVALAFKIRGKANEFNRKELDAVLTGSQELSEKEYQCCQA